MSTETVWNPSQPKAQVTVFHRRFGGAISWEQQLEDLTEHLPRWARPLWKLFLAWFIPFLRRLKIRATMAKVDQQAKEIGDRWAKQDRDAIVNAAVQRAKQKYPNAHVEVVEMPEHPVDAVYIEHPPTPGQKAQEELGFGAIEITAPWVQ